MEGGGGRDCKKEACFMLLHKCDARATVITKAPTGRQAVASRAPPTKKTKKKNNCVMSARYYMNVRVLASAAAKNGQTKKFHCTDI